MFLRRITGYLLVFSAGLGILFSIISLVVVWLYGPLVTKTIVQNLSLVDQSLNSTETVLTTINDMVQSTTLDVTSLQVTTKALSLGIQNANPLFDSLMQLTGTQLPDSISSTQTSLTSAASSAVLIDNALTALTSIPFSPIAPYKPKVPLHVALQNVSNSLNSITPSLEKINASLANEKANLGVIEGELTKISDKTQDINGSLGDAQAALAEYELAVTQLKTNVESAELGTPKWVLAVSGILTVFFIWLLANQVGLGLHGLEMIQGTNEIIQISNEAEEK